jgi:hypothetical protein
LQALGDRENESTETITLELLAPTGGAVLGTAEATVSVVNARRVSPAGGGGHPGVLGTTLLGLVPWWRRRRAGAASAH